MSSIDQLASQFKTLAELRQYANSQYQVIAQLNRKIVQIEEENKHLKELLTKQSSVLDDSTGTLEIYKDVTDELATCLMQIKLLKEKSVGGELTFEDAKKLDIYTKLLLQLKSGKKAEEQPTKTLTDEELLKLLNEEITNQNG